MHNRRGVENSAKLNKQGGWGNSLKFDDRGGVKKIFYDTIKWNTKNLKGFGFLPPFKNNKYMN